MKKKFISLRIIVGMCATLGWWGLIYPELVLTPNTVKVVSEADGEEKDAAGEQELDSELFWELMEAERGSIRVRSRLLEKLSALMEAVENAD